MDEFKKQQATHEFCVGRGWGGVNCTCVGGKASRKERLPLRRRARRVLKQILRNFHDDPFARNRS